MESLGSYVAKRRRSLGLTQQQLADALGYSVQAISKFEKGLSQMDLSSLPTLAKALSLSLDELLHQKEHQEGSVCSFSFQGDLLAANLSYLRAAKGLTQQEAGDIAHISARSLANYEKGLFLPSLATVLIYLDYYHVSADDLFGKALAPVAEKPVAPKRHLWRWLTPIIACLVAAIVIGSTSPLWFSRASSDSSENSSEVTTSVEDNSLIGATTSYESDNIAEVTGIVGRVNNALSATLAPGEYPLSVTVQPSEWYDDSKFPQIGWSVETESSTDPDGAAVRTDAVSHSWYLIVKSSCVDDKTLALKPYIKSLLDPSNHINSTQNVEITFSHANTVFNNAPDPIDDIISLSFTIDGQTSVSGPAGSEWTAIVKINPVSWLDKKVPFGLYERNVTSSNYIYRIMQVAESGEVVRYSIQIQSGGLKGDEWKGAVALENNHTKKYSVLSNYLDVKCV
jgi:transcriptional regulator with XRE-family HTH domain